MKISVLSSTKMRGRNPTLLFAPRLTEIMIVHRTADLDPKLGFLAGEDYRATRQLVGHDRIRPQGRLLKRSRLSPCAEWPRWLTGSAKVRRCSLQGACRGDPCCV